MPHPPTTTLTRRALLRATAATLGLVGATLLAACGNATSAPQTSAPAATAVAPASAAPSIAAAPSGATTLPAFNSIPQGRTPEGYFTLGSPDASVTLIDYSDFL